MDSSGTPDTTTSPMTTRTNLFHQLTDELRVASRTPEGRATLDRLREHGTQIDIDATLGGVVATCHGHSGVASPDARVMVDRLVALAGESQIAGIAAIVALQPALLRVATRVCAPDAPDDDAVSEVIAAAWEALAVGDPVRPTMRMVVGRTWVTARTSVRRQRSSRTREVPCDAVEVTSWATGLVCESSGEGTTLGWAVRKGLVSRDDARLIRLTRVSGIPLSQVASTLGIPRTSLHWHLQRAERAVRRTLREGAR